MTRTLCRAFCIVFFSALAAFTHAKTNPQGQQSQKSTQTPRAGRPPSPSFTDEESPPEEDESIAPEKFALDPLESDRNIRVGNYYWHKGKYRAALGRYERAAKYNPNSAEAFFKVGEAEEKLKNRDAATIAFQRVIRIDPESKLAHEAKKKLGNKS